MSKTLVLISGGVDSTVCLAQAVQALGKENVFGLSVFYGQKHKKELQSVENIVKFYGIKHISLDLSQIFAHSKSSLIDNSKEIAKGDYKEQLKQSSIIDTTVPFRNGMFISAATGVALSLNCDTVVYGAHKNDSEYAYPDCSVDFFLSMQNAVRLGSGGALTLCAPFIEKTKKDIVAEGSKLNVPFELTWSCYNGLDKPCGECATCIDRETAFRQNYLTDPLRNDGTLRNADHLP